MISRRGSTNQLTRTVRTECRVVRVSNRKASAMLSASARISIGRSTFVLAALALSIAGVDPALSDGRLVKCHVESAGAVELSGTCRFTNEKGGSFALENANRDKPLFGEILMVSVSIVSPDVAEVYGLTMHGNNSRWGAARRSARDRACWEGSDFRICAR